MESLENYPKLIPQNIGKGGKAELLGNQIHASSSSVLEPAKTKAVATSAFSTISTQFDAG